MTPAANVAPATYRGERVVLFLSLIREGWEPTEIRRNCPEHWPTTPAGERKWSRDKRDALALRIRSRHDAVQARRDRLVAWLAEHPRATVKQVAQALGTCVRVAVSDLRAIGAGVEVERFASTTSVRYRFLFSLADD